LSLSFGLGITAHAKWAHKKDKEIIFALKPSPFGIEKE